MVKRLPFVCLAVLCLLVITILASCGSKLIRMEHSMSINATGGVFQGVVLGMTDSKLSGAVVLLEEVNLSDTTSFNGEFLITDIPTVRFHLVVSLAGYDTTFGEVSLNGGWFTPGKIYLEKTQPTETK